MDELDNYCRLCSSLVERKFLRHLFDRSNRKTLRQIEEITGTKLRNSKSLPTCYCNSCETELENACQFRERVLKTQKHFRSVRFKEKRELIDIEIVELNPELSEFETQLIVEPAPEDTEEFIFQRLEEHGLTDEENEFNGNKEELEFDLKEEKQMITSDGKYEEKYKHNVESNSPIVGEERALDENEEFVKIDENEMKLISTSNISKTKPKKERNSVKFICDQCGNYFTCRHHFLTHLRRHAGDKQFQCELCADKFFTNSNLKRHMRRHTGERPFSCRYCDRNFNDYSSRIKHERTHTNERPFSCNLCGKSFTTSYILKNHMVIHTGERSFRCNLCNKSFQRQTNLATHFRSITHQQNEMKQKSVDIEVS